MSRLKLFLRGRSECYFDPIRRILVKRTREEDVRQELLHFLQVSWSIPVQDFLVEKPMSHFEAGVRGRADIVVLCNDEPLILIECKAPECVLDDDVLEQAIRYNEIVGANYLLLHNGHSSRWFRWDEELSELEAPRSLVELVESMRPVLPLERAEPLTYEQCSGQDAVALARDEYGILGHGSPTFLAPLVLNLDDILLLEDDFSAVQKELRLHNLEMWDTGVRETSFGNAGGGSYPGDYRFFLLRDRSGHHNVVSLKVAATQRTIGDPHWGNRNSYTSLIVAIDDFDRRHNSLQLRLDKYVRLARDQYVVWHDGTLTAGKRGACPRREVLAHMARQLPAMVSGDRIALGSLPAGRLFSCQDAAQFIANLIVYGLERDAFRELEKVTRKQAMPGRNGSASVGHHCW